MFHLFRAYTASTSNLQCLRVEALEQEDLELRWRSANCEKEKFYPLCVQKVCKPLKFLKIESSNSNLIIDIVDFTDEL